MQNPPRAVRLSQVPSVSPEFESLLQHLASIHPLPAGGRERMASLLSVRELAKGEYFVRAGETPTQVGFMVSGWLQYFYLDADGRRFVRYFCCAGNFVSSLSAMMDGTASAYSIQAVEASRLVVFPYHSWLSLLETDVAWGFIHRTILEQALARAERRERSLVLDDAATRYRRFLEELPGAEQHIKQQDIANYLGVNPVTLSRIRGARARRNLA